MSEPRSLRIRRPYGTVEEYLAAEAWSIDSRSVLLIDEETLPSGEVVKFEIVLQDGSKPIRAEGVVHKAVQARGKRPGGLRVKLKRMGAQTKAFIDRAVTEKKAQRSIPPPAPPPPEDEDAPLSEVPQSVSALVMTEEVQSAYGESADTHPSDNPPQASGVRHSKVEAPPNRDELLRRLRERATLKKAATPNAEEEQSA
ncbi:MAG TPA: hypothetical protein PKA88_18580 [Polyangiaceae bacterium]|nr:hypothetical protein [Polyangiaceae bacterium]